MKVCIVGLGAIGGLLAAWLARLPPARVQVSALVRGATLAAVREHGLRLDDAAGTHRLDIAVADSAAALGPQDLVIVAVKAPALPAVADAVAALSHAETTVLGAMNGVPWWFFDGLPTEPGPGTAVPTRGWVLDSVDPGGRLRERMPPARTVGGVVHMAASTVGPGHVKHAMGRRLVIGDAIGGGQAPGPRTGAVAALLAEAGVAVETSACIQREVWFKLWGNVTMNPVSALTGATLDRILADELVRRFCSAVMAEAQALGAAIGLPIEQTPEQRHAVTATLGAVRTSMLQDLQAGRALEIDALLSSVHEIGVRLARPTPMLDALLGLVRLMARQRGQYPPEA
jgi:2-dehydropantoate 2-reductase